MGEEGHQKEVVGCVPFIAWKQDLKSISLDTDRGQQKQKSHGFLSCLHFPTNFCFHGNEETRLLPNRFVVFKSHFF